MADDDDEQTAEYVRNVKEAIKKAEGDLEKAIDGQTKENIRQNIALLKRSIAFVLKQQQQQWARAASSSSASMQHSESEGRTAKRLRSSGIMDDLQWSQSTPIRSSDNAAVPACDTVGAVVDVSHIQASGLSWDSSEENNMRKLYIRQTSVGIWNRLNIDTDTNKRRHINLQGSPGTGKSSLVWAWCLWWSDNNPSRRLRWIHFGKSALFRVVDFSNGTFRTATLSEKNYSKFSDEDDAALYSDPTFSHVIVDGVHDGIGLGPVFSAAKQPPAARIVLVASWQVNLPLQIGFRFFDMTMHAWSLDDYILACDNEDFYNSVVGNLDAIEEERQSYEITADTTRTATITTAATTTTTTASSGSGGSGSSGAQVSKEQRIKAKYYYAGKSARWMFDFNTLEVVSAVNKLCIQMNSDTQEAARGNKEAKNSIFFGDSGSKSSPVSNFVGMWLVLNWTSTWLDKTRDVASVMDNRAFDGWLFEFEFKVALRVIVEERNAELRSGTKNQSVVERKLKVFTETKSTESWIVREITNFTNVSEIVPGLPENTWIIPTLYNQPCYDAVQLIDFKETPGLAVPLVTLRVVQITRESRHGFDFGKVSTLVSVLRYLKGYNVEKVEVVILVPMDKLDNLPAINTVDEFTVPEWDKKLKLRGFDPQHQYSE